MPTEVWNWSASCMQAYCAAATENRGHLRLHGLVIENVSSIYEKTPETVRNDPPCFRRIFIRACMFGSLGESSYPI